jgi:hypothetical protein
MYQSVTDIGRPHLHAPLRFRLKLARDEKVVWKHLLSNHSEVSSILTHEELCASVNLAVPYNSLILASKVHILAILLTLKLEAPTEDI